MIFVFSNPGKPLPCRNLSTQEFERGSFGSVHVPWHLRGLLLMNVSCALCIATWFERGRDRN